MRRSAKGLSMSGAFIVLFSCLVLFQLPLTSAVSWFTYTDELLALVMCVYYAYASVRRHRIGALEGAVIFFLGLAMIIGLVGNLVSGVSRTAAAILQDVVSFAKFYVVFLGAKVMFEQRPDTSSIMRYVVLMVRGIVLVGVACLLLSHLGVLSGMLTSSTRFGIRCFTFIYDSAGMLSQYCVLFTFVLLADFEMPGSRGIKWFYLLLGLLMWAATLRARALAMIAVLALLYLFVFRDALRERFDSSRILRTVFSPFFVIPCLLLVLFLARNQLATYFGDDSSARSYLLAAGIQIMLDFFPLGTGMGTYGTEAARKYYSPLYTRYGLSSHWALGEDGTELTDTFWPAIFAELGFIGALAYAGCLISFLVYLLKSLAGGRESLLAGLFLACYLLISSTATGVFFSYTATGCMLLAGLACAIGGGEAVAEVPQERRS